MCIDEDIQQLDLEPIKFKACMDERWSLEKADRTELEYKAFLQAYRDQGTSGEIAPSRDVDILWHHHILDTAKYEEDCVQIFGHFLHHYPYAGMFSELDAAAQIKRFQGTNALIKVMLSNNLKEKL